MERQTDLLAAIFARNGHDCETVDLISAGLPTLRGAGGSAFTQVMGCLSTDRRANRLYRMFKTYGIFARYERSTALILVAPSAA